MGHWTPTGIEPTDYDDDDELVDVNQGAHFLETFLVTVIIT